ncbi:MAG TPA: DUF2905 domain-containing protein [Candidatus Latescibacteria bacterium]|nr:DUF2905 domain-containing protein [Candidatus Latescibacterota bacterium]HQI77193.1 DUF2905 domain-containing protein [Candidatus Latescibacterota bacterium]HQK21664.1 DUF2905 domain-containing protein [Candidatus Latescibacterota bacterium]HRS95806.1 DUF2905 domain-containing protein [Candidatus Latescibacterota bacterium]
MSDVGKWIVVAGVILVIVGLAFMVSPKFPWLGRLPGDLVWKKGPVTVYVPLATMLLISIVATALVNIIARWLR